ncbi:Septum formation initiator [Desulfotomaculum nigrificans CO-1-SRB]|uniref:Cell division protein FtsL n=1 Tax=Desulfotomaculum nigrificans (strain DSM 14880 / VKM B-2319 / CO-1-SRB) TaxID=868595 RepID=F6B3M5_DESCC|nr:cell division protein FtsL [Desulfotomaculum nigrificans]AEF95184.1 Septum formation initiator [Desulfotomaculum nigrificans CO-1-SRB]
MSVAQEKFNYTLPEEQTFERSGARRRLSRQTIVRGKLLLTGSIFTLFLTGVAIAYYFAQIANVGYQISRLQNELDELQAEHEYLESQTNQLMSLQRIEAIATTKLGMVKPNTKEVVLVPALPANPQGEKKPTKTDRSQASSINQQAPKEDNQSGIKQPGSPVIGAFAELVNRWEKKL